MQHPDDNPRSAGRPSLLTSTQQADADRNRILSNLEGGKIAVKPTPRRSVFLWAGLGLGALALIGAGAFWFADGEHGSEMAEAALARAVVVPAEAVAAAPPAAAKAGESGPAEPFASLPVATINDEVGAAGTAPSKQPSLNDMLSAAPAAVAASKTSADVLSKALESPPAANPQADALSKALESASPPVAKARTAPAAKSEAAAKKLAQARIERKQAAAQAKAKALAKADDKAKRKAQALAKAQGKAPAKALASNKPARGKSRAEPDSDVTLLQALVAHAQAHPEPVSKPSIEAQLKQCDQASKTGAESCRARVCVGRSGTEACKARAAKAVSTM